MVSLGSGSRSDVVGTSLETGSEAPGSGARSDVIVTKETDRSTSLGTGSRTRSDVVVTKEVHRSGGRGENKGILTVLHVHCSKSTGLNSKLKRRELAWTESSWTKGIWLGRDFPLSKGAKKLPKVCGVGRDSPLLQRSTPSQVSSSLISWVEECLRSPYNLNLQSLVSWAVILFWISYMMTVFLPKWKSYKIDF